MLDPVRRDSHQPVFRQIKAALKRRIISGSLPAGESLPSSLELAVAMLCHPAAVERALGELVSEGWLLQMSAGTLVVSSRGVERRTSALEAGLDSLMDRLWDQARALGLVPEAVLEKLGQRRKTWNRS